MKILSPTSVEFAICVSNFLSPTVVGYAVVVFSPTVVGYAVVVFSQTVVGYAVVVFSPTVVGCASGDS